MLEYETANPGADFNEKEAEVFTFDEDNAATAADVARPTVTVGNPDYISNRSGLSPAGSRDGATSLDANRQLVDANRQGSAGSAVPQLPTPNGLKTNELHPGFGEAAYQKGPEAEAGGLGGGYRPSSSQQAA